jgi:hypothetical protein
MFLLKATALAAGLVFGSVGIASKAADNNGRSRVAFFGFRLINTSLESTTVAEDRRIRQLDELFRQKLDASGRFRIITIPPDMQKEVAAAVGAGSRSAIMVGTVTTGRRERPASLDHHVNTEGKALRKRRLRGWGRRTRTAESVRKPCI